jgi:hypothetical protein
VYFLLTGRLYAPRSSVAIKNLRRGVPKRFREVVETLLCDSTLKEELTALEVKKEFERILESII